MYADVAIVFPFCVDLRNQREIKSFSRRWHGFALMVHIPLTFLNIDSSILTQLKFTNSPNFFPDSFK